ncbi:MAG: hypothetical protein Fur006_50220 [Coleofasciculaceae cyanobacterium]
MSEPTRLEQPIILIRGFGGLDTSEEKRDTYQRFNVGTVYPQKQGENYIYEGMVLRLMKSDWQYQDATNVVGYYGNVQEKKKEAPIPETSSPEIKAKFEQLRNKGYFSGDKVVINPSMALYLLNTVKQPCQTVWVFRYYDLDERQFKTYGKALVRLIDFIRELAEIKVGFKPKVNIIAHSMGGLIVREAVQSTYPNPDNGEKRAAEDYINKIVTLGTPHQGITFQIFKHWLNLIDAEDELEHFYPADREKNPNDPKAFYNFHNYFPLDRLLTVVGTNYRTYNDLVSLTNRIFPMANEFGLNYNRSDGLVKQTAAQIPGASRTFVNKCHGGNDSLITSREAFEIATRFFFGNVRVRLRLLEGKITRGKDFFGKSEFFFGVSIKPRGVDFELFHQSREAENCYGPFSETDPTGENVDFREQPDRITFSWADAHKQEESKKLIWEGYLDTTKSTTNKDMVMRVEFYVGERDVYGLGFSDNIVFHEQYYVRVFLPPSEQQKPILYLHADEQFAAPNFKYSESHKPMEKLNNGWQFEIGGTELGFKGTFAIEVDKIPAGSQDSSLRVNEAQV